MENKVLIERLKEAGYKFAKNYFDEYVKDYEDDECNENLSEADLLDCTDKRELLLDDYSDCLYETFYHALCSSCDYDDFLDSIGVEDKFVIAEELDSGELVNIIMDGALKFINEQQDEM